MPADALLVFQPSGVKTATFNGTGVDLKTTPSVPRRGLYVRVVYSAAFNASGANAVTFSVDDSADNATFNTVGQSAPVNLTATAQAGEAFVQIPGTARRYVRVSANFGGAGSTPTITYVAQGVAAYP